MVNQRQRFDKAQAKLLQEAIAVSKDNIFGYLGKALASKQTRYSHGRRLTAYIDMIFWLL